MSTRVLKKLYGEKDLASVLGIDGMSESDDGGASRGPSEKPIKNRFELLNSAEHSLSDTEAKEDDDRENEPPHERGKLEKQDSHNSTDSLKRRKKKKKKKLRSQKSTEENLDDPSQEDEVEASLREVNKILGEPVASVSDYHEHTERQQKSVLCIDLRNLNPDNEMKKIFGSKVVQNEQNKKKGRGRTHSRSTVLVPQKNWSHLGKPGLSMKLMESKGEVHYFAFEHSKQYQSIQLQFLEAVESFNPNNIVAILNTHVYHIDALIQFSDLCKMGDDSQMAAELIERTLFYLENCLHPLFNPATGNCRLDYRIAENRCFFVALFKHLVFIGQRGCNRTSLEFCKLLLSLEPEEDPLGVILMIDFYALRSQQYAYLLQLFHEWDTHRNLLQLPNFAFSIPLASFLCDQDSGVDADQMLQNALIMFPGFLLPLLNRCNVEPDKEVISHPLFNRTGDPQALSQLLALYIERCHLLWKSPEVILWLENQVREVIKRCKENDPLVAECAEKRKMRFVGTPRNVLRHMILCDVKEASALLPPELMDVPIFGFDPLPPVDSVSSYVRPSRPVSQSDQNVFSMFFRSLLPNFNMPREGVGAVGEPVRGAEGGGGGDPGDLRRSVTSLLDAMRDLISNIHLVTDLPNEGDVDSDDGPQG